MTDRELQLIMAAFENHRQDVRADLTEVKDSIKTYAVTQAQHQRRFEAFDTVVRVVGQVGAWGSALIAAVWAVFTFKWGK